MGACFSVKDGAIRPIKSEGQKKTWINHNRGVKFSWESTNGILQMTNTDTNNALQSVLQVLIRIRPLMNFFMCEQMNGNYGKLMNNLFDQAYKPRTQKGGLMKLSKNSVNGFDSMSQEEQQRLLKEELEADFQKPKYDLMLFRQELSEKFLFSESLSVIDVFRYIYDQVQIEMIQYNNSNPDYGIPEYEGGDPDFVPLQLQGDANRTLDTLEHPSNADETKMTIVAADEYQLPVDKENGKDDPLKENSVVAMEEQDQGTPPPTLISLLNIQANDANPEEEEVDELAKLENEIKSIGAKKPKKNFKPKPLKPISEENNEESKAVSEDDAPVKDKKKKAEPTNETVEMIKNIQMQLNSDTGTQDIGSTLSAIGNMQGLIKAKMKEHVAEAMAKKWKLPEDIQTKEEDNIDTEEPEQIHIADALQDKNVSLKKKMKYLEKELGKKKPTQSTKESTLQDGDESEDTLANDSGSNTSLKDNTIKEGEGTFWSETFLHKMSQTDQCSNPDKQHQIQEPHLLLGLSCKRIGGAAYQLDQYFDIHTKNQTCKYCFDDSILSKKFLNDTPHILIVEMDSFNQENGKRLKLNKPMPLKINVDKYVLPSIDSKKEIPNGDYRLIAAICIDGKRNSKFKYYSLVLKKFQKFNTEQWVRYSNDDCHVEIEQLTEGSTNHFPQMLFYEQIENEENADNTKR